MALSAGDRIGRFEVLGCLGIGGMGEVYRAHDPQLRRDVAIKILPSAYSSNPDRQRRFEQEARAAGSLNHPNILAVYDVGVEGEFTWIVTELLVGETLRQRMDGRPLSSRIVIDYAIQIAGALAAAHERGIVHRDVKPANLFVTTEGRVKILDFGLAKLVGPDATDATETSPSTACRSLRSSAPPCTCRPNRRAALASITGPTSSVLERSCSRCWPGSRRSGAARRRRPSALS